MLVYLVAVRSSLPSAPPFADIWRNARTKVGGARESFLFPHTLCDLKTAPYTSQAVASAVVIGRLLSCASTAIQLHLAVPLTRELLMYSHQPSASDRCCRTNRLLAFGLLFNILLSVYSSGTVVVAESSLVLCVERLHRVFCGGHPPPDVSALSAVVRPLFRLFCVAVASLSHLTSACEVCLPMLAHANTTRKRCTHTHSPQELLLIYFRLSTDALPTLVDLILTSESHSAPLAFTVGPSAGIQITTAHRACRHALHLP